jgi:hypothetical protein
LVAYFGIIPIEVASGIERDGTGEVRDATS